MSSDRFRELERLFSEATQLEGASRQELLDKVRQRDPDLANELRDMLAGHEDDSGVLGSEFLDRGSALRAEVASGSGDADDREFEVPESVGRYRIIEEIARGGVGIVLRGRDDVIGRDVAIKILLDPHAEPSLSRRFTEEGQIGGRLSHPNIVPIHEIGETPDGHRYIAMKYIEGRTLAEILTDDSEPAAKTYLPLFERVCQAVGFAHSRGIIHRDLKPANLMVGAFGEVQVMDWGLARSVGDESASQGTAEAAPSRDPLRTLPGGILGTPSYMPPEQARGDASVGARADVFSLGAILCEILTGQPPWEGRTTDEILRAARRSELDEAKRRLATSGANQDLVALTLRCLDDDPQKRPADAGVVAEEVRAYLQSLEERAQKAALEATEERVRAEGERRARRLTTSLAAVILIALVIGGVSWTASENARRNRGALADQRLTRAISVAKEQESAARADGLRATERWNSALAAARNARELVTPNVTPALASEAAALIHRVETRHGIHEFLRELDGVRESIEYRDGTQFGRLQFEGYSRIFDARYGSRFLDLDFETAAKWVRELDAKEDFGIVLDLWARSARHFIGRHSTEFEKLLRIASAVDSDPWRVELRRAAWDQDLETLQRLALAESFRDRTAHGAYLLAIYLLWSGATNSEVSDVLERAHIDFPADFQINHDLANFVRGERALRYAVAAVVSSPSDALARGILGWELVNRGESELGFHQLDRALELGGENGHVLSQYAKALDLIGESEQAVKYMQRAIARRTKLGNNEDYANLGRIYFKLERFHEALQSFETARQVTQELNISSDRLTSWISRGIGQSLIQLGRAEEAIEPLEVVHNLAPSASSALNLGIALRLAGRVDESLAQFESALEQGVAHDDFLPFHANYGETLLDAGRLADAFAAFALTLRAAPRSKTPTDRIREVAQRARGGLPPQPVHELIEFILDLARNGQEVRPETAALAIDLWMQYPYPDALMGIESFARELVARTERADHSSLAMLGIVLIHKGEVRGAIRLLEEASRFAGAARQIESHLAALRAQLRPDLISYASIDAEIDRVGAAIDAKGFREVASGDSALARSVYLEARLHELAGEGDKARGKFEEVLRLDRTQPEPFLALWRCTRSGPGAEEYSRIVRAGALPEMPISFDAGAPSLTFEDAQLKLGAIDHPDPRVKPVAAHWQVCRDGDAFELDPVVDQWRQKSHDVLPIGAPPAGAMRARARVLLSDGRATPFTPAIAFEVSPGPRSPVRIDLRDRFTHDVVFDSGDPENDALDIDGHTFSVDGDPFPGTGPLRGLPRDRRVGAHELAPYDGKNVILLSPASDKRIELEVDARNTRMVRILTAGANGEHDLPVTMIFESGEPETTTIQIPDWFADPEPRFMDARWTPIRNGMDRILDGAVANRGDPALAETRLEVPAGRTLRRIVLDAPNATFSEPISRIAVFSIVLDVESGAP